MRQLLAPLQAPLYVLPGNHDDRGALHRHFGVPGADGDPVQYSVDFGPLRLVVLDTTRPGEDPGRLTPSGWAGLTPSWPRRQSCPPCSRCTIHRLSPAYRRVTRSACLPPIGEHSAMWWGAISSCDGSLPVTCTAR